MSPYSIGRQVYLKPRRRFSLARNVRVKSARVARVESAVSAVPSQSDAASFVPVVTNAQAVA